MPLKTWRCSECLFEWDVTIIGSRVISHGGCASSRDCPACGSSSHVELKVYRTVTPGGATSPVKFPYFDRGLGQVVTSPTDRLRKARALGLVPTDGESIGTWEDIADKEQTEIKKDLDRYNEYVKEATEGPARHEVAQIMAIENAKAAKLEAIRQNVAKEEAEDAREQPSSGA